MGSDTTTYRLLDSGHFQKLEQVGPYRISRPAAAAVWSPRLGEKEWQNVDASFERFASGQGKWSTHSDIPEQWPVKISGQTFQVRRTGFGHLGVFFEQKDNWSKLRELSKPQGESSLPILNLFAYTGGSTVASAQAGASVVHLDASKTSVNWARANAKANGLEDAPIRWITDDVSQFVEREIRRGNKYRGIILDPPSYGQGPKKQAWIIEDSLVPLLKNCREILADHESYILLTCHSNGYTPQALQNLLSEVCGPKANYTTDEMLIDCQEGFHLPSGAYCLAQIP